MPKAATPAKRTPAKRKAANPAAVKKALTAHLKAHGKAIDALYAKIKKTPGAVNAGNKEQLAKLIGRAKQQHAWLTEDAFGLIPPIDGPGGH
jgi:hypothetical protein